MTIVKIQIKEVVFTQPRLVKVSCRENLLVWLGLRKGSPFKYTFAIEKLIVIAQPKSYLKEGDVIQILDGGMPGEFDTLYVSKNDGWEVELMTLRAYYVISKENWSEFEKSFAVGKTYSVIIDCQTYHNRTL